MATELRIPEGIVIRTAKGGPGALDGLLRDLRSMGFAGYLKVVLDKPGMVSEGYLVIEAGSPTMAIYYFEKSQPRELKRIYAGDRSLRFVQEDAADPTASVELHSRVGPEEFSRRFPDCRLTAAVAAVAPAPVPEAAAPVQPLEAEPQPTAADPILEEIARWRQQGYDVAGLERLYERDRRKVRPALEAFQRAVERLKNLEHKLESLEAKGFEQEKAKIRTKVNDPSRITEIEHDLEMLEEQVRQSLARQEREQQRIADDLARKQQEQRAQDVYDLILQYQKSAAPTPGTLVTGAPRAPCPTCGGPLDIDGTCPRCTKAPPAGRRRAATPLTAIQTFESFIVGPGTKFAHAASLAVAKSPQKGYNPLFLYGGTGLGKTHLLNAIGNHAAQVRPTIKVAYVSAENFTERLEEVQGTSGLAEFRNEFRELDLLLIDDLQFLTGKERAQEELLHTLTHLIDNGRQAVLASDRLPKNIPAMNERLVAKLEGGLIADLQPPDLDTRLAILQRKAGEQRLALPEEVLRFVAERATANVRELEGAFNRLVAFASIMKVEIDLGLAKEVLRAAAPQEVLVKEKAEALTLRPAHSYLVEEDTPISTLHLYARLVEEGYAGLAITRQNPARIREEYGGKGEVLWLTDRESSVERTIAPSLESIIHTIEEFMAAHPRGVLVLDGLPYLISNTNFDGVLRFLRRLIDDISESSSLMVISASPSTLHPQELSILERELEVIKMG